MTLWDCNSLTQTAVLRGHSRAVGPPAFSPDGRTLYTASSDGTAIAWDTSGDRGLVSRVAFNHCLAKVSPGRFSPDGSLVAVSLAGEGIALWNADDLTPSGTPLLPTGGHVKDLAFSPDGRLLAAYSNDTATIWDVETRSLLHDPLRVDPYTEGIGFSQDATTLVVAGQGIDLFDVASGAELGRTGG